MYRIVRAEFVKCLSDTTILDGLRDHSVVLKHCTVEAVTLVVSWFAVDEIVRVLSVDPIAHFECAIYQKIACRIVLAASVVVVNRKPGAGVTQPVAVHEEVAADLVYSRVDGEVARVGGVVYDRLAVP